MVCMDDHTNDPTQESRNDSEQGQNGSEQTESMFPNWSEQVPNDAPNSSEPVRNASEQGESIKAVPIRTVRNSTNGSEKSAEQVPHDSEQQRTGTDVSSEQGKNSSAQSPHEESERFRTAPLCSESHEGFTITIREAARLFEEAGVPRTERAITKWCNLNARGVTRLDCCYSESERKYYITPESIERVTVEERKKFQYVEYRSSGALSADAEDLAEHLRGERVEGSESVLNEEVTRVGQGTDARTTDKHTEDPTTAHKREREEPRATGTSSGAEDIAASADARAEFKKLQMENYELKVQLEGQKYLVMKYDDLVEGERQRHQQEKLALVDRLTDARHQIGTLEQKLLQLEAPRPAVREAETG
jgi:hypothetical protein